MKEEFYIQTKNYKKKIKGNLIKINGIDRECFISNYNNIFFITDKATGMRISEGKTQKQAINNAEYNLEEFKELINNGTLKRYEENFKKCVTRQEFYNLIDEFDKVFDVNYYHYIDELIFGLTKKVIFNVTHFHEDLLNRSHVADYENLSLKELIKTKYGEGAVTIFEKLCL